MAKSKFWRAALIAMALAFTPIFASPVVAQQNNQIDISKLPKAEADRVLEIINGAQQTTQNVKDMIPKREDLSAYAELGKNMAEAVAQAAKTVGVEVVNFSKTDLGWWLMVIIFYKLIGADLAYSVFSNGFIIFWLIVVVRIWWKLYQKMCMVEKTETRTTERDRLTDDGKASGLKETVTEVTVYNASADDSAVNGTRVIMFIALIISTIPAWIMLAN